MHKAYFASPLSRDKPLVVGLGQSSGFRREEPSLSRGCPDQRDAVPWISHVSSQGKSILAVPFSFQLFHWLSAFQFTFPHCSELRMEAAGFVHSLETGHDIREGEGLTVASSCWRSSVV